MTLDAHRLPHLIRCRADGREKFRLKILPLGVPWAKLQQNQQLASIAKWPLPGTVSQDAQQVRQSLRTG